MLIIQKAALTIEDDGLHYGALKLAQVRGGVLKARPAAFARLARPEQAAVVEKAIADWNRGEKTSALIRLVHLGAPELAPAVPSPGWLRHCALVRMAKAGFDPNQPRDEDGKWTDEGDSDGDAAPAASPPGTNEAITVTPASSSDSSSGSGGGTIDDGVYHTTVGPDGQPVLPTATPVQAEVPEEEESTGEDGEEKEREEGIIGLTSEGERFVSAYNTLRELDPDNEALQQKYLPADISSGAAADDLETAAQEASIKRNTDFLKPNGQLIGQKGGDEDVRLMSGDDAETQAAFKYLSTGGQNVTPPGYKGILMKLPGDAGMIGYRPVSSKNGPPTVDINIPGIPISRLHYIGK